MAARRQLEMMIVMAYVENGENAESQDEDDVDITGLSVPESNVAGIGLLLCTMVSHFTSPWQDE